VAQSPREEEAEVVAEEEPRQPQVMSGDASVDIQLDWGDE
jgi:hypothetical protein